MHTLQMETTVLPGSRIELESPDLVEGQTATVFIIPHDLNSTDKRPLSEILAQYTGPVSFRTADEVEKYLRAERDAWEN